MRYPYLCQCPHLGMVAPWREKFGASWRKSEAGGRKTPQMAPSDIGEPSCLPAKKLKK